MRSFPLQIFLAIICCFAFSGFSVSFASENAREIVKRVAPCVVHLESKTEKTDGRVQGRIRRIEESGSGVLIAISGTKYVLTNRHIVANVSRDAIRVHLADRRVLNPVRLLASEDFDVALLELEPRDLPAASIGDSDTVEVPDPVFAFGSPFGLRGSVSAGIIAAKNRRKIPQGEQAVPIQGFFQTDASINPGSSGGPLVDQQGNVIGIITAIASSGGGGEGVAFAIPINRMMKIAKELVATGTVSRPRLGIELDPRFDFEQALNAGLDRNIGTRIEKIAPHSPGEKAGLRPGDIVLSFNGITVEDDAHFVLLVAESTPGDSPRLEILRGKARITLHPVLGRSRE